MVRNVSKQLTIQLATLLAVSKRSDHQIDDTVRQRSNIRQRKARSQVRQVVETGGDTNNGIRQALRNSNDSYAYSNHSMFTQ